MKNPWVAVKLLFASSLVQHAATPWTISKLLNPIILSPMIDLVYKPNHKMEGPGVLCPEKINLDQDATLANLILHTVAYLTMSLLPLYLTQHSFLASLLFPVMWLVVLGASSYLLRSGILEALVIYAAGSYIYPI